MNRGTEMTVVRVAPTRDPTVNPSSGMADKHGRLLCGRTLDEWWAIQSWASRHVTHSLLVAESAEHKERLEKTVRPYGCAVISRPETMNHPTQDSGGFPVNYGYQWLKGLIGNINLVLSDFVVNPLKQPWDIDRMIELFIQKLTNPTPDAVQGACQMISAAKTNKSYLHREEDRLIYYHTRNTRYWPVYVNVGLLSGCTARYYEASHVLSELQLYPPPVRGPWFYEVEEWQEVHIDTEHEWDLAEYCFGKHIGGKEAYDEYRAGWAAG